MTSLPALPTATGTATRRSRRDNAPAEVWVPTVAYAYHHFAPAVLGYFRSHRVDDAEDLVGDVFVGVARSITRFRGDAEDLRRWVFTIARRRRVDHIRRRSLRRLVVTSRPPERPAFDLGDAIDPELLAALQTLTSLQREVVVLRFVADLSIEDVAEIVRRSTGAVKALQSRALAQLAGRLHERSDVPR
jgi:RNA polymerase sigma-70 factor (ECF subfamily)